MESKRSRKLFGVTRYVALEQWRAAAIVLLLAATVRAEDVLYDVTFDATWSAETHPYDFPPNPHFSGLVGGTHQDSVNFWRPGGIASDGIEAMAERGSQSALSLEVQAAIQAGTASFVILGGGIGTSPGSVATQFVVSDDFPLVTLVSMIAPSPDWFVGVSALNMRPDGQWLGRLVVDLWPYDAGSDSGPTFASPDDDTNPQIAISHLSGFPFAGTLPLGTYTFVRVLAGDYNRSGTRDVVDLDELSSVVRTGSSDGRYDLDANGVVNGDDRTHWIVDLKGTYFGDSNLDGEFNSDDLVGVFQAGQYEDTVAANSTWSSGDWNGDAEFNSSDLILAFQYGAYGIGPRATVAAVPEPAGHIGILMAMIMGVTVMRRAAAGSLHPFHKAWC